MESAGHQFDRAELDDTLTVVREILESPPLLDCSPDDLWNITSAEGDDAGQEGDSHVQGNLARTTSCSSSQTSHNAVSTHSAESVCNPTGVVNNHPVGQVASCPPTPRAVLCGVPMSTGQLEAVGQGQSSNAPAQAADHETIAVLMHLHTGTRLQLPAGLTTGSESAAVSAAGQSDCSVCRQLRVEGDSLHQALSAGAKEPGLGMKAVRLAVLARYCCINLSGSNGNSTSSSSTGGRMPCLMQSQLPEHGWAIAVAKARQGPVGGKRAANGTSVSRNFNFSANSPMRLYPKLEQELLQVMKGYSSSGGRSSSNGNSSSSGGSSSGGLYAIRSTDRGKTVYALALHQLQAAAVGSSSGPAAEDDRKSSGQPDVITCRKRRHALYDQPLTLFEWAFCSV